MAHPLQRSTKGTIAAPHANDTVSLIVQYDGIGRSATSQSVSVKHESFSTYDLIVSVKRLCARTVGGGTRQMIKSFPALAAKVEHKAAPRLREGSNILEQ